MYIIDLTKVKGFTFTTMPQELIFPTNIMRFNNPSNMLDEYSTIEGVVYTTDHPDYAQFEDILKIYDKYNKTPKLSTAELNKVKIYVIVREKKVKKDNPETPIGIIPINNYDNLSNHPVSRLVLHRDAIFQTMIDESIYHGIIERQPGNRCMVLRDLLSTKGPFEGYLEDVKIEDLTPQDDSVKGKQERYDNSLDKLQATSDAEDDRLGFFDGDPELEVARSKTRKYRLDIDSEPDDGSSPMWMAEYGIPRQEYEYDEADADNALFTNPKKYFTKTDNLEDKNIIPIFASLEEAENLLTTALEDVLFPYIKKKGAILNNDRGSIIYEANNIDYLDDSFTFMNRIFPNTKKEKKINWRTEHRRIKPITKITNHYKNYYNRKEVHVQKAPNLLLKYLLDTKIIEMGLGDFYDLLETNETKIGELIFIPPTKKFKKRLLPFRSKVLNKNSTFSKYQKKYQSQHKSIYKTKYSYSFEVLQKVDIMIEED